MKLGIVCGSNNAGHWINLAKEAGADASLLSPLESTAGYDALWIHARPTAPNYDVNLPTLTAPLLAADMSSTTWASLPLRRRPEIAHLQETLSSSKLGQIGTIRLSLCRSTQSPGSLGYDEIAEKSGALRQLAPHAFDAIQWCFGDIDRIHAVQSTESSDAPQYALITFRMASGAIGHLELSLAEPAGGDYIAYEIAGANGILEYDSRKEPLIAVQSRQSTPAQQVTPPELIAELRDFITGNTSTLVTCSQAQISKALTEEAIQTASAFVS